MSLLSTFQFAKLIVPYLWEYMRLCPDETNYSTIAKGAKVTRHTVARWYAIVKEMVYGNSNNHSLCHSPDLKN